MTIQLLDHQTSTGLGPVASYSPHNYRSKIVRVHVEISGATSGDMKAVIRGKLSEAAPWYTITEVVANWMTPTTGQEACNDDNSFAVETTGFPLMKVNVGTYTTTGAAKATSTVTFTANPVHKDLLSFDDNFGHTLRLVFHTAGDLAGVNQLGIPVEIGATKEDTAAAAVVVIEAYGDDPHPNYKGFHISSVQGDTGFGPEPTINLTHDIPGTSGNSATTTVDGSNYSASSFSGGSGTDRYISCWLDDNF